MVSGKVTQKWKKSKRTKEKYNNNTLCFSFHTRILGTNVVLVSACDVRWKTERELIFSRSNIWFWSRRTKQKLKLKVKWETEWIDDKRTKNVASTWEIHSHQNNTNSCVFCLFISLSLTVCWCVQTHTDTFLQCHNMKMDKTEFDSCIHAILFCWYMYILIRLPTINNPPKCCVHCYIPHADIHRHCFIFSVFFFILLISVLNMVCTMCALIRTYWRTQ